MRAFGDRLVASITTADIERFLRRLDREGLTGRNVNVHRQALAHVFEYATRADTFALPLNLVRVLTSAARMTEAAGDVHRRASAGARAGCAQGLHMNGRRWAILKRMSSSSVPTSRTPQSTPSRGSLGYARANCARCWRRHVRFTDRTLVVVASMSAGIDSSTKSGKMACRATASRGFVALDHLSRREWFIGPDDFVFCGCSATRSTTPPCDAATAPHATPRACHRSRSTTCALRSRPWATRGLDPATVQTLLGHSKITTTDRYLHARPLTELAERMGSVRGTV